MRVVETALTILLVACSSVLAIPAEPITNLNNTADATALGINCKGSGLCGFLSERLTQISALLDTVPDDRLYSDGYNIACQNHLCAFYQNTMGSNSGARARELVKGMLDFGCKICGSNPVMAGNDVSTGQLTVNYVSDPACQGVCWN